MDTVMHLKSYLGVAYKNENSVLYSDKS